MPVPFQLPLIKRKLEDVTLKVEKKVSCWKHFLSIHFPKLKGIYFLTKGLAEVWKHILCCPHHLSVLTLKRHWSSKLSAHEERGINISFSTIEEAKDTGLGFNCAQNT